MWCSPGGGDAYFVVLFLPFVATDLEQRRRVESAESDVLFEEPGQSAAVFMCLLVIPSLPCRLPPVAVIPGDERGGARVWVISVGGEIGQSGCGFGPFDLRVPCDPSYVEDSVATFGVFLNLCSHGVEVCRGSLASGSVTS